MGVAATTRAFAPFAVAPRQPRPRVVAAVAQSGPRVDLRATPIDGFEFLRRVRSVPEYRSMAIVVSTALDDADLAAHGGLPAGTVRYGAPPPLDTLRGFVEACALRKRLSAS